MHCLGAGQETFGRTEMLPTTGTAEDASERLCGCVGLCGR